MSDVDVVVVGAGVVGLAVARELAREGRSVLVLEAEDRVGTGTSSRNSEVVHAGLYYPAGSLKARLCVEGRRALYAYCEARGVAHARVGKLVVATDEGELASVEALARKGRANGCDDLEVLTGREATAREPALRCVGALWSPSTGIVDSHGLMAALKADAVEAGVAFAFRAPCVGARRGGDGFEVSVGGEEPSTLTAGALVNAAGLGASLVARGIEGVPWGCVPETRYVKGSYFVLEGRAPFRHLVYPVPHAHGLGVHLTLDLGGSARFGPDVEWVDALDYAVDPARAEGFARAVRRYWPGLPEGALAPGFSGVRPRIAGPDEPTPDFRVDGAEVHGVEGLVNLFGIESPGLTASLALAREVARRLA